jgi:Autographiviridae endonuclease VII
VGSDTRKKLCSVRGCTRPSKARTLCTLHYQRYMATGTTALLRVERKPIPHGKVNGYTYYGCRCDACSEVHRDYQRAYGQRRSRMKRNTNLRRRYGIDLLEYERLLELQGGGCGVCGISVNGLSKNLGVDHDHTTGRLRGILCTPCNRQLGIVESKLIEWAPFLQYLKKEVVDA